MKKVISINTTRKIAFIIMLIGAVGSLCSVLNAGRNSPFLLLVLFAGWVLSPYIALFLMNVVHKLHSVVAPVIRYWLMLLVSLGSLAAYAITLLQHRSKPPTGVFLSVPFLSWVLIIVSIATTAFRKRKKVEYNT